MPGLLETLYAMKQAAQAGMPDSANAFAPPGFPPPPPAPGPNAFPREHLLRHFNSPETALSPHKVPGPTPGAFADYSHMTPAPGDSGGSQGLLSRGYDWLTDPGHMPYVAGGLGGLGLLYYLNQRRNRDEEEEYGHPGYKMGAANRPAFFPRARTGRAS
jgi:hypothetical protein